MHAHTRSLASTAAHVQVVVFHFQLVGDLMSHSGAWAVPALGHSFYHVAYTLRLAPAGLECFTSAESYAYRFAVYMTIPAGMGHDAAASECSPHSLAHGTHVWSRAWPVGGCVSHRRSTGVPTCCMCPDQRHVAEYTGREPTTLVTHRGYAPCAVLYPHCAAGFIGVAFVLWLGRRLLVRGREPQPVQRIWFWRCVGIALVLNYGAWAGWREWWEGERCDLARHGVPLRSPLTFSVCGHSVKGLRKRSTL